MTVLTLALALIDNARSTQTRSFTQDPTNCFSTFIGSVGNGTVVLEVIEASVKSKGTLKRLVDYLQFSGVQVVIDCPSDSLKRWAVRNGVAVTEPAVPAPGFNFF